MYKTGPCFPLGTLGMIIRCIGEFTAGRAVVVADVAIAAFPPGMVITAEVT